MNEQQHSRSITGKIIITCLLAFTAIFLSLYIARVTFNKILSTVDELSTPNARMELVNDLFKKVVQLDQLQRNQALSADTATYDPFIEQSKSLQQLLDSLRDMSLQNPVEVQRIDSMKQILYSRDLLFLKYTKLYSALVRNDTLADEVKGLTRLIEVTRQKMDSNVVTTSRETKTVVDTILQKEERRSLWNRVFSKRKPRILQVQKQIAEELKVRVDTLRVGNRGDSLAKIGTAIAKVEMKRLSQRTQLLNKEIELSNTGNVLIEQLMSILNDIEQDELQRVAQQNTGANKVVSSGITKIGLVFAVFILATIVLIVLIFADIARSNRYRRELVIAKEEAEEAGRVKQRFLASMSHELRTPLQTIIGTSEQVKDLESPRRQDLENIHRSSLHLLQIVNEVLDYSRIMSGKYVIEHKPFNMCSLLGDVRDMVQVQAAAKGLALHYRVSIDEDRWYLGDAFRLRQVLLNVLGNAIKFTDEGGVTLAVTEKARKRGRSVFTFVISDTGPGISKEDLAVIFNEFEQGTTSKKQGTGLGLSIVKTMTDLQQGTIKAESDLGVGTTFTIDMPYTVTEAREASVVVQDISAFKGHVWVVDDDAFIVQLCDTILTKHRIPHTCFTSSRQASETEFPVGLSIAFLDVHMAGMDGIELCRTLRARGGAVQPKYIALTAQAFTEEREALLQKGFDALVIKPFLEQDILAALAGGAQTEPDVVLQSVPDLSVIRKMTGDDEELFTKVLQNFVRETNTDLDSVRKCMAAGNASGAAAALHKLAARMGQVGISMLANDIRTTEVALYNGASVSDILPAMDALYQGIDIALLAVNKILGLRNVATDR